MTNKETITYLFRKFPETKFSRSELMWKYLETYKGVKFGHITKQEFKDFFSGEFWGLERTAREMLKDPEFKLKPEIDKKRYEKEQEFVGEIKQYDFRELS